MSKVFIKRNNNEDEKRFLSEINFNEVEEE